MKSYSYTVWFERLCLNNDCKYCKVLGVHILNTEYNSMTVSVEELKVLHVLVSYKGSYFLKKY